MDRIKTFIASLASIAYGVGEKAYEMLTSLMVEQGLIKLANLYSQFTYDDALSLRDWSDTAITSTETGSTILDVGNGLLDGLLVVDITAIDTTTGDEAYSFMLEGSPDATFGTAGNIRVMAELRIGGATFTAPNGAADAAARYVIPFRNERGGTTFRYLRLYVLLAGTSPSLDFGAFIAKR